MRKQMKIVSDVETPSRIKTDSALPKVRHVKHIIRQDILRQFANKGNTEQKITFPVLKRSIQQQNRNQN